MMETKGNYKLMGLRPTAEEEISSMIEAFEWKIKDVTPQLAEYKAKITSDVFLVLGYHFSAQAKVTMLDQLMKISLQLIERKDGLGPTPKITYILKDQSNSETKQDRIYTAHHEFREYRKTAFTEYFDLPSSLYIKDNCIRIKMLVEPSSIARSFYSNNGILVWKMANFRRRLQLESQGLTGWHDSPYFYTAPDGYRVMAKLSLCDCAGGKARLLLVFLTGENDFQLTPDFHHRVTVVLINQEDQSKDFVTRCENDVSDYDEFILEDVSTLESDGYVKDDSLLLKIAVESLESG